MTGVYNRRITAKCMDFVICGNYAVKGERKLIFCRNYL